MWLKILRYGTSWISIDDWYVFLYSVYVLFAQRASTYVFSISKSFCKSCISPEYFNCDNSHFPSPNLVLQLLRAIREVFTFPGLFHMESTWNPWNPWNQHWLRPQPVSYSIDIMDSMWNDDGIVME